MSVEIKNKQEFNQKVLNSDLPVLVDFWASWCGPCKKMSPIVDELADEMSNTVKIAKVNVEQNQDIAQEFGIMKIPTMVLFQDGEEIDAIIGGQSKSALKRFIEDNT